MKFGDREAIIFGCAALIAIFWGRYAVADIETKSSDSFFKYDPIFKKYSKIYRVPWRWIKAVAWNESSIGTAKSVMQGLKNSSDIEGSKSFDGKSWGIMQVTLATARELRPGTTVQDLNNPDISISLGAQYLGKMMARFDGDREKVIRAYNGGPGFEKTVLGRTSTPLYYAKFLSHLNQIMERQPGNQEEI